MKVFLVGGYAVSTREGIFIMAQRIRYKFNIYWVQLRRARTESLVAIVRCIL